jgi:alpha-galactosidase
MRWSARPGRAVALLALSLLLGAAPVLAAAGTSIRYIDSAHVWILSGGETSYVLGVNERGELQSMYWGARVWREQDWKAAKALPQWDGVDPSTNTTPEEYPGWGGLRFFEPCVKATLPGSVRDVVLKYASHSIDGDELVITLKDIGGGLTAELHYRVYPEGIIAKSAVLRNTSSGVVTLESAQSGAWLLPAADGYHLSYLAGRWGEETLYQREPLHRGSKVIESRRGSTSNQFNPWFAIDGPEAATEEHGPVWFGALGWSGSWKITVEETPHRDVRVTGGYNDFDFAYPLQPGATLTTPPYYAGFTNAGFGGASRQFHRFQLARILPRSSAARPRPVLYNSWEATGFAVDEKGQTALAEKAAQIGVERFVMDDGWFGERNTSRAGLGDWTPNPKKFPTGLKPLIDNVKRLGMDFGLWVEPEMVNPDSALYRAHPDWALNFPGRPRSEARSQLVLNLSRDDVKEYVFAALDKLVSENDIAFLKWDLNRNFSEPGWPEAPVAEQKTIWVRHVSNYYEILDRLRAKHPKLEIESCASGGGRVDLGVLARTEEVWPSDNTDAFDRLSIQYGYSHAYTPKTMMAWVTDVPSMDGRAEPLEYRFLVAMMGSLGIGSNLTKWNDADSKTAARLIAEYKQMRGTVQEGDLYRLLAPGGGQLTANQYVARDGKQAVLFAFLHSQQYGRQAPAIHLRGLDAQALYKLRPIEGKLAEEAGTFSGAWLMNHGLTPLLKGDYAAVAVVLERVE